MISKTDYITYLKHPAWLWLCKNQPDFLPDHDENTQAIIDDGREFRVDYHAEYYSQGYGQNILHSPPPTILRQERENDDIGYLDRRLLSPLHDIKELFLETYEQDDIDNFEDYIWRQVA